MPQLWYIIMVIKKSNTQFWYITMVFSFLKKSNNYLENHHVFFCLFFHETYYDFEVFEIITKIHYSFFLFFQIPKYFLYFFSNVENQWFFDFFFLFSCTWIKWLLKNKKTTPHWFILMLVGCRFATRSKSTSKSKSMNQICLF